MNHASKRKAVTAMSTEALQRIADASPGTETSTPLKPLAGLVHITGIGQVPKSMIREELATR